MSFIDSSAHAYTEKFSSAPDELLQQIARDTYTNHAHAHMLSGHVQGLFLQMISKMIQPRYVLEIGTFTGFSALCLAQGLTRDGVLHTIEIRDEDADTARKYFEASEFASKIKLHVGDAKEILKKLSEPWDLVFIDADKPGYIEYYELTLPMLKPGGFILADNVLFHGQVLEEKISGKNAVAIQAFNEHIKNDSRVEQVMLTIRDGISMIRKL